MCATCLHQGRKKSKKSKLTLTTSAKNPKVLKLNLKLIKKGMHSEIKYFSNLYKEQPQIEDKSRKYTLTDSGKNLVH